MNWKKLEEENAAHCVLKKQHSRLSHAADDALDAVRDSEEKYGRGLRNLLARRVNKITSHVSIYVTPLVNHSNYTASALVKLRWADKGANIELSELLKSDEDVAYLLNRLKVVVESNR